MSEHAAEAAAPIEAPVDDYANENWGAEQAEPPPEFPTFPDYPDGVDVPADEQLLPDEIAEIIDSTLEERVGPWIAEQAGEVLAPYQESLAYLQQREMAEQGRDAAEEWLGDYAQTQNLDDVDTEAVLERADAIIESLADPERQPELEQVATQMYEMDPQRGAQIVEYLQQQPEIVEQLGPGLAFAMTFDPAGFGQAMLGVAAEEVAPGRGSGNPVHDVVERYYGPTAVERVAESQPLPGGPRAVLEKYYGTPS